MYLLPINRLECIKFEFGATHMLKTNRRGKKPLFDIHTLYKSGLKFFTQQSEYTGKYSPGVIIFSWYYEISIIFSKMRKI